MHGVIDGYSRLVVFLRCSSNNRAATVVNLFLSATIEFYWLQRVRTEKGEENSEVARLMAEKRREGRGSIFQGSLVHNQRIERLWRDIREMVTEYFRLLTFPRMEQLSEPDRGTGSGSSTLCIYFTD